MVVRCQVDVILNNVSSIERHRQGKSSVGCFEANRNSSLNFELKVDDVCCISVELRIVKL